MAQDPDHDRIAQKAHELWEADGRPHGRDQDHWDQAREMVAIEDSQADTLLPRDAGADTPIEEPAEALQNLGDMPNLTDQGENLLTSTDREPPLTATPSGRRGRMPKVEVPTSDQPGIAPKGRKSTAKSDKAAAKSDKSTASKSSPKPTSVAADPIEMQPKTASIPVASAAAAETTTDDFVPRRGARRRKGA